MPTLLERLTSASRLRLMAGVLLAFQVLTVAVQVATAPTLVDANGVALGRDFVPFYTAGRIVAAGGGKRLYDYATQARVQADVLAPASRSGTAFFTNPAFFALPYALLARLPYRIAFLVHAALMGGFAFLGVRLLAPKLAVLGPHWKLAALVGLAWFPMANSVLGGQNPALTFALLAAAYVGTAERRPWLAGVALGLLLFKPQYALPMIGLLLVRGEWRVGLIAAAAGGAEYLAGAAVAGWSWPARLAEAVRFFAAEERVANGPTLISLPEWFDFNLGARPLGLIAAALLGLVVAVAWRRGRAEPRLAPLWALAVCGILLASLHTQHYDVAILLLPTLLLLDDRLRSGRAVTPAGRLALLAAYFAYPAFLLGRMTGIQPLVVLPAAGLVWGATELRGTKAAVRARVG